MECYICYEQATVTNPFLSSSPCQCKGTIKLHKSCHKTTIETCGDTCGICKTKYRNVKSPVRTPRAYNDESLDLAIAASLFDAEERQRIEYLTRNGMRAGVDFPVRTVNNVQPPVEGTVSRREYDKLSQENQKLKDENKAMKELLEALLSKM